MKGAGARTAVLGSGSLASLLAGLLAMKAYAVMLGAAGMGRMGLLLAFSGLGALVLGSGLSAGMVRDGAGESARGDREGLAASYRAAWIAFWGLAAATGLLALTFQGPARDLALGGAASPADLFLACAAMLFTIASDIQCAALNARGLVRSLAMASALRAVLGALSGTALVFFLGEDGVATAVLATAIAAWAASRWVMRREFECLGAVPERGRVLSSLRSLLSFWGPYTMGAAANRGALLVLPVLALHALGYESVGQYRAALVISTSYLGFLMVALGQEYFPRVSASSRDRKELTALINEEHRLVMLLAVPGVFAALALAPWLVPCIYSAEFLPAVDVLEWQLVGDLFRFSSWTLGFAVLARSPSRGYLWAQLVSGAVLLLSSWLFLRQFGLAGLGMGFLTAAAAYRLVTWDIVRRELGFAWTPANRVLFWGPVAAAFLVRALGCAGLEAWERAGSFALAGAACAASGWILWRSARLRAAAEPAAANEEARIHA